ncbi:hypothetical protein SARC_17970, partial [Sphaeroforma arctica JP610]
MLTIHLYLVAFTPFPIFEPCFNTVSASHYSAFSLRETLLRDTSRVEYPSLPFLVLADHQFKVFSASAPPSAPASAQNSPIQTRGRRLMSRLAAQVTAQ